MAGDIFTDLTTALKNLGTEYDRDLRGATSPFRDEIKPEGASYSAKYIRSSKLSKKNNYYDLLSYQWYTSDIPRRFKDDYYNSINIEFAKNNTIVSKGIKDTIVNAISDKYNAVKDTVIDSASQIKNSVNSIMGKTESKASPNEDDPEDIKLNFSNYIKSFPYAKIYEFKPRDTLGITINALTTAFKAIDSVIDTNGNMSGMMNQLLTGVSNFLKTEFGIDLKDPKSFADPAVRIDKFPNSIYKNLISGYFTGYYEIPVLEYSGYLTSEGSQGWEAQSFTQRFLTDNIAGAVKGFMSDKIGSAFDIATRPKWGIDGGGKGFPQITLDVYLFNENYEALCNNLAFIHSYVGGNLWYQDGFIQKCPSLYDVEVPGRFRYYFCTCDVEVTYIGKVRQVTEKNSNLLVDTLDGDILNLDVLNNVPDAYKVSFNYNSIIPNNFNSYMAFITQTSEDAVEVGQTITSFYEKLAESINASMTPDKVKTEQQTQYGEEPIGEGTNVS